MAVALVSASSARAEFELKEAEISRGEIEIEYRGSAHHRLPRLDDDAPVRQSHDVEYEWGATNWLGLSAVTTWEELGGADFRYAATTVEAQLELVDRPDFAMSMLTEYQFRHDGADADEYEFGPVANWWFGKFDILTNTFLTRPMGSLAETNSWGLQYDVRARYWRTKRFAYGVELHGEIEELDNAGPFESQEHYAGPVLYWAWGEEAEEEEGFGEADISKGGISYGLALGAMIGLTDVTSEAALKVQMNLEF